MQASLRPTVTSLRLLGPAAPALHPAPHERSTISLMARWSLCLLAEAMVAAAAAAPAPVVAVTGGRVEGVAPRSMHVAGSRIHSLDQCDFKAYPGCLNLSSPEL